MNETIDFNLNESIYVKLTDSGKKELVRQWEQCNELFPKAFTAYTPRKEDDEGFSKWQLHDLMSTLGYMCKLGVDLPFETLIKLEK